MIEPMYKKVYVDITKTINLEGYLVLPIEEAEEMGCMNYDEIKRKVLDMAEIQIGNGINEDSNVQLDSFCVEDEIVDFDGEEY